MIKTLLNTGLQHTLPLLPPWLNKIPAQYTPHCLRLDLHGEIGLDTLPVVS